ncbi:MAG: DUF6428 family protein [Pseudomonadota bacterium]
MTPQELYDALAAHPQEAALQFSTDAGPISGGYHVTEWKAAKVQSIDCGGQMDAWDEATLQLLDGHGGAHMRVGKFNAILKQSIAQVKGLGAAPLQIEFAHQNHGKHLYAALDPVLEGGNVVIALRPDQAACKVVTRAQAQGQTTSCCRPSAANCC